MEPETPGVQPGAPGVTEAAESPSEPPPRCSQGNSRRDLPRDIIPAPEGPGKAPVEGK